MPSVGGGSEKKKVSIELRVRDLTSQGFKTFEQRANMSFKAVKQSITAVEGSILAMAGAIKLVGVKALKDLTKATTELAKNAVETSASFEQLEIQFGFIFGSAEEGRKKLDEMWKLAKEVPFTIKELASSAKLMKVWGVMGQNATDAMKGLADITALSGERMDLMARVVGRAWQQGRFLQRGPGAMLAGLMKTKMGFDVTKASVDEFRDALARLMVDPKLGVAGMSEKLATTFTGIKSMISDAITNIELALSDTGFFDEVKAFAEEIRQFLLGDMMIRKAEELGRVLTRIVESARDKFKELIGDRTMEELIDHYLSIVKRVSKVATTLIDNIPEIARFVMNLAEGIAIGIGSGVEMVAELFQEIKATVGHFGILGGKVGELKRSLMDVGGEMEASNHNLATMQSLYKSIIDDASELKDNVKDTFGFQNDFNLALRTLGKDVDFSEIQEVYRLLADIRQEGIGTEAIEERTKILVKKLKDLFSPSLENQEKMTKELNEQYNALQNQLSAWQANNDTTAGIKKKVAEITGEVKNLKTEMEDAFKTDDPGKEDPDSPESRLDGLNQQADTLDKKIADAFDLGDKPLTEEDFFDLPDAETFSLDFVSLDQQWSDFLEGLRMDWEEFGNETVFIMEGMAKASARAFEDFFFDLFEGELKSFSDYRDQFIRDMNRQISSMIARQAVEGIFGNQGLIVPEREGFSNGGTIGGSNLGFDAVPIMATAGEMMLNKRQQRNMFNMINRGGMEGGGSGSVPPINFNMNLTAMDGADAYRTFERNKAQLMAVMREMQANGGRGIGF